AFLNTREKGFPMTRLESNEFPIESTGSFTENRFDLHNTDTAAGPQRPFELRRESLAEFDSEFRVAETIHSSGKSPEVVQALANADRLFAEREYRIAEGLYRSVLRLHSDDEQVIRGLAKCLRAQDRHEEAVKVLRQLVRQHNSAANFFLLAEELYVMNYNEDALDTYFNVLRFGTSEPTV